MSVLSRGHTVDTIWTQAQFRVPDRVISKAGQRSLPCSQLERLQFRETTIEGKIEERKVLIRHDNGPPVRIRT